MKTRIERDSMGEVEVPLDALYGAQTRRAQLNFPVSGWRMPAGFVRALARIKRAAAQTNHELGLLDGERTAWIESAAGEIADGGLLDAFVVDVFQTGSGTSTNMNMNEVIANRAARLAGDALRAGSIHPNDHVNMGQSSNDVIPTALHVAAAVAVKRDLLPSMELLLQMLEDKASLFHNFVKIGRTHLQDATPIRMGQVFSGYAAQVREAMRRVLQVMPSLCALPIGGTAVGTGLNTHPTFAAGVCSRLAGELAIPFEETGNHFEAAANRDGIVELMGALKAFAVGLNKIANDIRYLASGPRCGYGELQLPAIQPGSSIMPGKVNPVICESVMQVAAHVVGADATVAFSAATLSQFELCTAVPVMAYASLESIRLLGNVCRVFVSHAISDLACHPEHCRDGIEASLAMCTSLAPKIGYDRAAQIAKTAFEQGRNVREVAMESGLLPEAELADLLDPTRMTEPRNGS